MSTDYRHKMIMDPVHGNIGLSELETNIVDTPTFQRLRRLKQLGFASFVYPNASYSRFAHSLGVLHIASRVAEEFLRKGHIGDEAVKKLRIAALLHDIGQYPYSHLMEFIEREATSEQHLEKEDKANQTTTIKEKVFPDHDELGKWIVKGRGDIINLLDEHRIDPNEIAALMGGEHPEIPNVLHKSLDIDRLDYLVRDSLNTGLPYGRVDLDYILNNMDIVDKGEHKGEIVLKEKARLSCEHLLLARYFMFNAVYLHKTVFGFEELVRKVLTLLIKSNSKVLISNNKIKSMIEDPSDEFLSFDDSYLDRIFDEYATSNENETLNTFCYAIKHRQPPKMVHEIIDLQHRGDDDSSSKEYTLFRSFLQHDLDSALDKCGINKELVFWREPKDVRFEAAYPFVNLSDIKDFKVGELRGLVKLKEKDGNIINLMEDKRSIIYHLSQLQAKAIRLYAVNIEERGIDALSEKVKQRIKSA
ncbi:MAG: HD domain-containing protein [Planctomycetes bacterium]|nr:HD domain-containing protein [Planctomycetota bacterium]